MKILVNVAVSLALVAVWFALCALLDLGPYAIRTGVQVALFGGYGWPHAFSLFGSTKLRNYCITRGVRSR